MKLTRSFKNAWNGVVHCFNTQLNFRIQLVAIILVTVAGFMFDLSATEWIFVTGCCFSVLVMELLNTAVEKLCDLVTREFHPVIKIIKDVAAGAVLVSAIGSTVTGIIIFFPKILAQIKILL